MNKKLLTRCSGKIGEVLNEAQATNRDVLTIAICIAVDAADQGGLPLEIVLDAVRFQWSRAKKEGLS